MKKKQLFLNTVTSLINQVVVAICGLILPRVILSCFGSEVNGLVQSITQFLSLIAFMELGVGAVVQSAMYKPLAIGDDEALSKIMISARRFFRNIAKIFAIYVIALVFIYPYFIDTTFDPWFSGSLVAIIAISSFSEYYFGIINQLLLNADQKAYIQLILRSVIQIASTGLCVVFIYAGASIQVVKLTTSLLFMVRPLVQWIYVKKNYKIDYSIELTEEPIKQKWNGLAQHIAAVVLDKTDMVILTFFSTLSSVSIYSVYYLVVNNLRQLISSMTVGIQALLGNLLAKGDKNELDTVFNSVEIFTHFVITFLFAACGCLILPFVKVYTRDIIDANYIVPVFAVLMTLANAFYSLRNSYNMMIKAAGHYKETQNSAIIEVVINVVISLVFVAKLGFIGVAIGTMIAMLYRTLYLVYYLSKHIIYRPVRFFAKNVLADAIAATIICVINSFIKYDVTNYLQWFVLAVIIAFICFISCVLINYIIYRDKFVAAIKLIRAR